MEMYENMGDALAVQYGGSAAHNKVYNLYYSYILHLGICVHHTFVKKWVHLILRKLTWKMLLIFWQVFSQHQGRWNATIQSLEFFRSIQRHYNNAYLDSEKQDAIDMWGIHLLLSAIMEDWSSCALEKYITLMCISCTGLLRVLFGSSL